MSIKLKGSSDGSVSFDAPADTSPSGSDITLTLPTSAGSANQFLKNSGIAGELEYSSMVEASTGVGIGTSPTTPLQVHSSTTASTIRITNSTCGATSSDGLIIQESGNDAYIWNKENSFISFGTNNAERMRINNAGQVGIGTTTVQHSVVAVAEATNGPTIEMRPNQSSVSEIHATNRGAGSNVPLNLRGSEIRFGCVGLGTTEAARIDSSGNLFLNSTSQITNGKVSVEFNGTTHNGVVLKTTRAAIGTDFTLYLNSSGSVAGRITHNGSTTVSYTTSSDYRLKENVVEIADAITRVKQLAPKRFNFIEDGPDKVVDGFLAHEAQTVVPEAVTGTHNEVDDDGNAVMQGIDQSKLVPLLTAALQEAIAKIETLETKVAALEAA